MYFVKHGKYLTVLAEHHVLASHVPIHLYGILLIPAVLSRRESVHFIEIKGDARKVFERWLRKLPDPRIGQ